MDAKRKADYTAVALQSKKPRHELVVHAGEKGGLVQSVSYFISVIVIKTFGWISYEPLSTS